MKVIRSIQSLCIFLGLLTLAILGNGRTAQAQQKPTYTVLHTFTGADGTDPQAALIRDHKGNLYSTTFSGGDLSKCGGAGCGVVFKLDANNKITVLYTFEAGADGAAPAEDVFRDAAGNLYGTTHGGGDVTTPTSAGCTFEQNPAFTGCGVVFKVDPNGKETALYAFTGSTDGGGPSSGLIQDSAGNLYGTTVFGGDTNCTLFFGRPGCGVVYKLDPAGEETVVHSFSGGADGFAPYGNLLSDKKGNLFGIGSNGGNTTSTFCGETAANLTGLIGCGTIFKIDAAGNFTLLHTFKGTDGGPFPDGWLARDHDGNFYGMTGNGGNLSDCGGLGCGVVFRMEPSGQVKVLYRFTGGADGAETFASVVRDAKGNLYGTTAIGSDLTDSPCAEIGGCGVVFRMDPAGHETVLYTFKGGADGSIPNANLLLGADGNLYGTAQFGGDASCSVPGVPLSGCGVVFKITLPGAH